MRIKKNKELGAHLFESLFVIIVLLSLTVGALSLTEGLKASSKLAETIERSFSNQVPVAYKIALDNNGEDAVSVNVDTLRNYLTTSNDEAESILLEDTTSRQYYVEGRIIEARFNNYGLFEGSSTIYSESRGQLTLDEVSDENTDFDSRIEKLFAKKRKVTTENEVREVSLLSEPLPMKDSINQVQETRLYIIVRAAVALEEGFLSNLWHNATGSDHVYFTKLLPLKGGRLEL